MRRKVLCLLLAVLMILPLAACGKKNKTEATPSPSPTPEPTPTAVFAPAPTQTAAPTQTPAPTLTPAPTVSAAPTQSAAPAASASPTAAPTPTFMPIQTPAPILRGTPTPAPTPSATPSASPTPAADSAAAPTPTPAPTPAIPAYAPVITKQPSGEGHYAGESAVFVTYADKWTSLEWTAVSPSGRKIDLNTFRETFPDSTVTGDHDTTLTITNLNIDMSGWSFFCTFTNEDASTPTEEARLKVTAVAGATTNANGEKVNNRILRCPYCGEEVFRSMLTCPYCGGGIWDDKIEAYVYQDQSGSIFYIDPTGTMFYDARSRSTTFEDHNSNYAVFDANGKPKFGNYEKEQQDLEDHALLVALGLYP